MHPPGAADRARGRRDGGRRRPFAIVAGLVTTFTLFTLAGAWIFSSLGLSARWQTRVGVAVLLLLALTLAVPRVGTGSSGRSRS